MPPLSVTQVVNHIGLVLEVDELLSDIYVQGEVSRVSKAASGHCYFALKDDESVLEAVMFRGGVGADHLIQGEEVLVFGRVTVYARQGRLQIIANLIQPSGIGELQVRFEQMKSMLESEGLFDASRKRPLPAYPEVIGVATSE
ncbi:MAG: exodeoxyribonuclease VII large subunit, partial [SAR202 cluster bacterium]|nr:exodeoxyribonuclease VII large subunit [SAR202 cluster bacterium]